MTTPPRYNWQRWKDWRRKGKILRTWLKFAFCKLTPQATVRRQGDACQTDVLRDLGTSPSVKFSPGWSKVKIIHVADVAKSWHGWIDIWQVSGGGRPIGSGQREAAHNRIGKPHRLHQGLIIKLPSTTPRFAEFHPVLLLWRPLPPEQHSKRPTHLFLQLQRPRELAL